MMSSKAFVDAAAATTTTSFSEFLNQEVSMARQLAKQNTTRMTLKGAFETIVPLAAATATKVQTKPNMPVKRINKQNKSQQMQLQAQQQLQHQNTENCSSNKNNKSTALEEQPNISPTDPAATCSNAAATALHMLPTIAETTATTITTALQATKASVKDVENSLNKTQWANVCFSSKGSPRQKCAGAHQEKLKQNELQQQQEEQQQHQQQCIHSHEQQQEQQHEHACLHCSCNKSANINSCCCYLENSARTLPQMNNNRTANTTTNATVANISSESYSRIIITDIISTTEPTSAATTASTTIAPTSHCIKASSTFTSLQHRLLHHFPFAMPPQCSPRQLSRIIQMESLLRRAVMFAFVFIMSLQFQTGE